MTTRIRTQLISSVALISLTVFALLSFILIRAQRRSLIEEMAQHAEQWTETIRTSTRHAMMGNRGEDVHQIIDAIGELQTIRKVRIFNKEGRIIYSPEKTEIGTMVDKRAEACYGCHAADSPLERLETTERARFFTDSEDQMYLGFINPIYNEPGCSEAACHAHPADQTVLGVLDVTLSMEHVETQVAASLNKAILLTAVTIFSTSLIIVFLFHRLVAKPVEELLAAMKTVATGNLDYRIKVKRNDELGELGRSFNRMTGKLAETQNQLYQSNKLASVGRLAAGIAHEINNPLTGVLTFSSLLLKNADEDPELKEDLETIVGETKRCRQIVKGLLDFSRQVPPHKSNRDFNDIVERALGIVDHQLVVNNIRVTKTLAEDLPAVRVDPNQMAQVLINLLVNAADAIGPDGGEIFVSTDTKEVDGRLFVETKVADDGFGIQEEEQSKIFEPFFTTKEGKGTGLGLAVVWGIVNEHDGSITVSSRLNRGATFTVLLPVEGQTRVETGELVSEQAV